MVGISCAAGFDLIGVATSERAYIYDHSTSGEAIGTFDEHEGEVRGLDHLCDDKFVSVDENGTFYMWKGDFGIAVNELYPEEKCLSISKASATEVLVATDAGQGGCD